MLAQALESALGQDGVELEVIVVDEGSTDDTPRSLQNLVDPRVDVVRNEEPTGVAAARNAGLERASGDWVAFLDDDDLWAPGKARAQLAVAGDDTAFVSSAMVGVNAALAITKLIRPPAPELLPRRLFETNPIGSPSCVMARTRLLHEAEGFDERLSALADWDLWLRLVPLGTTATTLEPVVAYREHSRNMMSALAHEMLEEFEVLRNKHKQAAGRAGVDFGRQWLLRWQALGDVAAGRRLSGARRFAQRAARERSVRHAVRALATLAGPAGERLGRRLDASRVRGAGWLAPYRAPH